MGVRFVFDPERDYLHAKDSVGNRHRNVQDPGQRPDWEAENRNVRVAATALYGKATVVITANYHGGGFSSAGYMDYDLGKSRDPIDGSAAYSKEHLRAGIPRDAAGLLAFSYYVGEAGIGGDVGNIAHHAHEFGHYFGLHHTFAPDEFADTPDDFPSGSIYYPLGSSTCGNARTVSAGNRTATPDRSNNEGYFRCEIGRTLNSFSPMQLGKANWVLQNQLNRYPLVACQPVRNYDADHVECENVQSLALCRETADYLKQKYASALECRLGGRFGRAIAAALQYPAVRYLLRDSPPGQALMHRLAGLAGRDGSTPEAAFDAVLEALRTSKNLPVTMAILSRIRELEGMAAKRSPSLGRAGFGPNAGTLTAADRQALSSLAGFVIGRDFIANVPVLVPH
jgi:hypothetical protein